MQPVPVVLTLVELSQPADPFTVLGWLVAGPDGAPDRVRFELPVELWKRPMNAKAPRDDDDLEVGSFSEIALRNRRSDSWTVESLLARSDRWATVILEDPADPTVLLGISDITLPDPELTAYDMLMEGRALRAPSRTPKRRDDGSYMLAERFAVRTMRARREVDAEVGRWLTDTDAAGALSATTPRVEDAPANHLDVVFEGIDEPPWDSMHELTERIRRNLDVSYEGTYDHVAGLLRVAVQNYVTPLDISPPHPLLQRTLSGLLTAGAMEPLPSPVLDRDVTLFLVTAGLLQPMRRHGEEIKYLPVEGPIEDILDEIDTYLRESVGRGTDLLPEIGFSPTPLGKKVRKAAMPTIEWWASGLVGF